MKSPGRFSPLRKHRIRPVLIGAACALGALALLGALIGSVGFTYNDLGYLRRGAPGRDDIQLTLMVDRLATHHRTMLLYYRRPRASQTPTSGLMVPMSPGKSLRDAGVALVRNAGLEDEQRILALARRGGGSYWTPVPWAIAALTLAAVLALMSAAMFFLTLRKMLLRSRARRALNRTDRGLCPACRYTTAALPGRACPECGADTTRLRRRAETLLGRTARPRGDAPRRRPWPVVLLQGPRGKSWLPVLLIVVGVSVMWGAMGTRDWPMIVFFIAGGGLMCSGLLWTLTRWAEWSYYRSIAGAPAWTACPLCGYSLEGLQGPQCPECGENLRALRDTLDARKDELF